jgi:integrase
MARPAKAFPHEGQFKTNAGGPPRTVLCSGDSSPTHVRNCLNRWLVKIQDVRDGGKLPAGMSPAEYIRLTEAGSQVGPGAEEGPTTNRLLVGPKVYLFGEVYDDFLDFKRLEGDPETYIYYRDKMRLAVARFGNRPILSITEEDGLKFRHWLHKEKPVERKGKVQIGLKPCSVNHAIRTTKTLFNWVLKKPERRKKYGLIETQNPWSDIKYLPEQGRERLITTDEFDLLLKHSPDQEFREMLFVLRGSTLRPGELRKMLWSYINWESGQIVFPPHVIKNRTRRAVTMIDQVWAHLKERRTRMKTLDGPVFPAPDGHIWKPRSLSQKFRRLFDVCVELEEIEEVKNGERLVLHSHRHTRCTEMYVEGHDEITVMEEAGHKTAAMARRYRHLTSQFTADKVRRLAPQAEIPAIVANGGSEKEPAPA